MYMYVYINIYIYTEAATSMLDEAFLPASEINTTPRALKLFLTPRFVTNSISHS